MATAHDEIIQLEGQLVTHYVRTLGAPTDNTYSDQSVTFTAADDQVRLLMGALNPDWSHDHTGQRLDELQTFAMMESTSTVAKGDYLLDVDGISWDVLDVQPIRQLGDLLFLKVMLKRRKT